MFFGYDIIPFANTLKHIFVSHLFGNSILSHALLESEVSMKKALIIVSAIVAVIGLASVATVLSFKKEIDGVFDLVDEDGEPFTDF